MCQSSHLTDKGYNRNIHYCNNTHYEDHWQQVFFIIFSLLANYCDVEKHPLTDWTIESC